jgi:uridine phosphorylase
MAATDADLALLGRRLEADLPAGRPLYLSRVYALCGGTSGVALAGPLVGAPFAVMVLESLIAWGARRVLFMGWCGAISTGLGIGDLLVPSSAHIDEGTSAHYPPEAVISCPSESLSQEIADVCRVAGGVVRRGGIWTTDAVFRETRDQVNRFQSRGAVAVDMETSALFTVASFRGVDLAAVLVVSDDLSSLRWRPGFKDPLFSRGREAACEAIRQYCQKAPTV